MKPLIIYHANCADGFAAAFAAWLKFGYEAEYLPMQYLSADSTHVEFLYELAARGVTASTDREFYILDFSIPKACMEYLFAYSQRVIWLDHHKTAFETFEFTVNGPGEPAVTPLTRHNITLDNNKSGALLAWEYFHPNTEVPMLIKHIDDYDRWQFKLKGTKELNKALWSYAPWSFEQWQDWLNEDRDIGLDWMRNEGEAILRAHNQNVQSVVDGGARKCVLPIVIQPGNLVCMGLAANCPPHLASDVGHELAKQSGTFALLWHLDKNGKCLCSLRSNGDYDVSAIAKTFGGGGHKAASGFTIDIQTLLGWLK